MIVAFILLLFIFLVYAIPLGIIAFNLGISGIVIDTILIVFSFLLTKRLKKIDEEINKLKSK